MSPYLLSVISSLILSLLLSIFQLVLAISLSHKICIGPNKLILSKLSLDEKVLRFSAMATFVLFSLSGISVVIIHCYNLSTHSVATDDNHVFITLYYFYLVFSGLGFVCWYLFLLSRLYVTFKGSMYEIKSFTIRTHIGILILSILSGLISSIMLSFGFNEFILNLVFAVILVAPILAFIHLIYSFNYRLFQLVLLQRITIVSVNNVICLSERQMSLLAVVRRHTLLGVIVILLPSCSAIVYLTAITVSNGGYRVVSTYLNAHLYTVCFDIFNIFSLNIASLCLYLSFSVNMEKYLSYCVSCDQQCKVLCESLAQSKINGDKYDGNMRNTEDVEQLKKYTPPTIIKTSKHLNQKK